MSVPTSDAGRPGALRRILGSRGCLLAVGVALGAAIAAPAAVRLSRRAVKDEGPPAFVVGENSIRLRPGAPSRLSFETAPVELGPPLPRTTVTGRVATVETLTAPSFAPLAGRVVQVRVRMGTKVAEGERLVQIRTGDLAAMYRERQAATIAVRTKKSIVDRLGQLVESRAASNNDLLLAQSELEDAKAASKAAEAKLRSLMVSEQDDTLYWILANHGGVVVQLDASPGKSVGPNSEKPVATVASLDEVLVLADVPQAEAAMLQPGLEASIALPGSAARLAVEKIESVADVVDPDRQTVLVRVRAKNPSHLLRPNAYVDVTFSSSSQTRVLQIPAAAVVTDGDKSVVFVETAPGLLERRAVEIGQQAKERIEIVAGLKVGEKVVARGALLLLNALHLQG